LFIVMELGSLPFVSTYLTKVEDSLIILLAFMYLEFPLFAVLVVVFVLLLVVLFTFVVLLLVVLFTFVVLLLVVLFTFVVLLDFTLVVPDALKFLFSLLLTLDNPFALLFVLDNLTSFAVTSLLSKAVFNNSLSTELSFIACFSNPALSTFAAYAVFKQMQTNAITIRKAVFLLILTPHLK